MMDNSMGHAKRYWRDTLIQTNLEWSKGTYSALKLRVILKNK